MSETVEGTQLNNEQIHYITVVTDDSSRFKILIDAARGCNFLNSIIDNCEPDKDIPIHNVSSNIFSKIVEYLNHYRLKKPQSLPKPLPATPLNKLLNAWDYNFISRELFVIFELITAANVLDIPGLVELCATKIASEIRGRSVEEIRNIFNIQNDFNSEEEQELIEENQWLEKE